MEKEVLCCPFCKEAMEAGYVIGEPFQWVVWHTENARPPLLGMIDQFEGNPNAVFLLRQYQKDENTPWKRPMTSVRAYLCRACKKCVVDYDTGAEVVNTDIAAQRWNRY